MTDPYHRHVDTHPVRTIGELEREDLARRDAEHVAALTTAMARVDPEHEWASVEWARRIDIHRAVRRACERVHRDQRHHAATIADARRELAAKTLARVAWAWVSEWLG